MADDSPLRIGIDLGGTKIEAAALDAHGTTLLRRRAATPSGDYDATLAAVRDLVEGIEGALGRRGSVGIGTPGAISPASGLIKNANAIWLLERPLDRDLAVALDRPVRLANDANCFALSEAIDGAAAAYPLVFGVILGTGVGGGIVWNQKVVTGANAIAGEWGHNPLPWPRDEERPGPFCYCGRRGCLETWLSGPGLARDHAAATGESLEAAAVAAAAEAGDPAAAASFERYLDRLARGLATVVNLLDPDAIVLGGGLSNVAPLYDRLPELLAPNVFSDRVETAILAPRHGDSSGVRGAAWLWSPEELDSAVPRPPRRRAP
ncbi:MAG TPA: ROK family protein [Kiloniellales bacterium]|nr:ROK family protein [Kiloniellales bacterium]